MLEVERRARRKLCAIFGHRWRYGDPQPGRSVLDRCSRCPTKLVRLAAETCKCGHDEYRHAHGGLERKCDSHNCPCTAWRPR